MERWRRRRGKRRTGTAARTGGAAAAMLAAGLGVFCTACSEAPADRTAADACNAPPRSASRGGPGNAFGGAFIGAGGLGSLGAGPTSAATADALEGTSGSSSPLSPAGCGGTERPATPEMKAGGAE